MEFGQYSIQIFQSGEITVAIWEFFLEIRNWESFKRDYSDQVVTDTEQTKSETLWYLKLSVSISIVTYPFDNIQLSSDLVFLFR